MTTFHLSFAALWLASSIAALAVAATTVWAQLPIPPASHLSPWSSITPTAPVARKPTSASPDYRSKASAASQKAASSQSMATRL
jgi:hypothetical protein